MNPTQTKNWNALKNHFKSIKNTAISDFFDEKRMADFTFDFNQTYFDFSKHRIDSKMLQLFADFANEMQLNKGIDKLFSGEIINHTEQRAVLHTALRQQDDKAVLVKGKNIIPEIRTANQRLEKFANEVINGTWKGITGKKITDVVNIGIGGSDLGPRMIVRGLSAYQNHLKVHYLSNIDPFDLDETLKKIDLETTLFLVISKSFSTQETLTNARAVQQIYKQKYGKDSIAKHFATVSTKVDQAEAFGIAPQNIFPMWDWVGGRFSLWSPAGISIMLAVGVDNFNKLLEGASTMDKHFKNTDFNKNIPAIAAFLTILYNNFYQFESETTIPYAEKLSLLPDFLQQLLMESNGKTIDNEQKRIDYQTGNIVWGNAGTNAQHSFFQLLHQGTKMVPVTFMAEKRNKNTEHPAHHQILMSNMIAQSEALMNGERNDNPYKNFEGNRPSTTILFDEINPNTLGALIAFYEHKTFVEGYLWNINSFDQFGVELGKKLAQKVLRELTDNTNEKHDPSTKELINRIKE